MRLKVVLERSEEGGYTAFVPFLPGYISEGDTREQALIKIKEAIELYVKPVPDDAGMHECRQKGTGRLRGSEAWSMVCSLLHAGCGGNV